MHYDETKQLLNGKWIAIYYEDDFCRHMTEEFKTEQLAKSDMMIWKVSNGIDIDTDNDQSAALIKSGVAKTLEVISALEEQNKEIQILVEPFKL